MRFFLFQKDFFYKNDNVSFLTHFEEIAGKGWCTYKITAFNSLQFYIEPVTILSIKTSFIILVFVCGCFYKVTNSVCKI